MLKTPILRCGLLALAWSVSLAAHASRHDAAPAGALSSGLSELRSAEDTGSDGDTGNRGDSEETQSRLQEVIVTARRREENAQEVPIAITVISQQTLQDNNVQTIGDLQYIVPSMSASAYQSRDALNVSIRGQGVNASSALPGVIAYLNEVPLPTDSGGNINGAPGLFFDLENVQVLKGPQGTLFGRNSVGGALLLQTARPKSELGATLQLGYGNHSNTEVDGAINIPLVKDTLLARVAVNGQWRDGFTQLLGEPSRPGGTDVDNRNSRSIRGTVSFQPGRGFQNDTIATYSKSTNRGTPNFLTAVEPSALIPTFFPAIVGQFDQQRALGSSTHIPLDTDLSSTFSNLAVDNISSLELSGDLRFRNIFGYDEQKLGGTFDSDDTALPIYQFPQSDTEQLRQFTEEAQLLGKSFGGALDWIVGGFYLHQPHTNFVHQTAVIFGGVAESGSQRGDLSKAVYAQGTYDLSALLAHLGFTAGLRYTWDDRFLSTYVGPRSNEALAVSSETRNRALTWTLGLNYQVTPETLLYLASRRGYRPGGPNNSLGNLLPDFDPEYLTDGELGVKSDWTLAGVPIRTNVALYYQKYTDVQVSQLYIGGSGIGTFITRNAAAARQYGAEFESVVQLTHDVQLGASFDYLNFEYTKFSPGVDTFQLGSNSQAGRPRFKYGVNARYQRPLGPDVGDISVEANWNWQANSGSLDQSAGGLIPSFGLLNMSAAWNDIGGTHLGASLFASNVLDKVYSIGGFGTYTLYGISTNKYGEPRMYGIRLRYRF